MPIVGGRHPGADIQSLHTGQGHVGGAVVAGDYAPRQQHVVSQLSLIPGEDPGPDDELHVAGLVLDSHEYRTLHSPGMLPGHGPAGYQNIVLPRGGSRCRRRIGHSKGGWA